MTRIIRASYRDPRVAANLSLFLFPEATAISNPLLLVFHAYISFLELSLSAKSNRNIPVAIGTYLSGIFQSPTEKARETKYTREK